MQLLCEFEVLGVPAVPWSVPDIGTGTAKDGRRFRFARRPKKTAAHLGKVSLETWQKFLRDAAREAFGCRKPTAAPCWVHIEFLAETPAGKTHGTLWPVEVKPNKNGVWTRRGRNTPDLLNCFKAAEDAIQGVVYHNDCQTRIISSVALYGPLPGARVVVWEVGPDEIHRDVRGPLSTHLGISDAAKGEGQLRPA